MSSSIAANRAGKHADGQRLDLEPPVMIRRSMALRSRADLSIEVVARRAASAAAASAARCLIPAQMNHAAQGRQPAVIPARPGRHDMDLTVDHPMGVRIVIALHDLLVRADVERDVCKPDIEAAADGAVRAVRPRS